MADTVILAAANALLTCLCEQLELNPAPPAECCLRAGDQVIQDIDAEISVDKVCCPGLAYVRLGTMYPSSDFPGADTEPAKNSGCFPIQWAVELVMGVVRCVPDIATTHGPDCADWTLAATRDANDMDAMRKALCCWGPTLPKGRLWLAGASTITMAGNCIERVLPVTLQIPRCC